MKVTLLDLWLGPLGRHTQGNKGQIYIKKANGQDESLVIITHTQSTSLSSPYLSSVAGLVLCQQWFPAGLCAVDGRLHVGQRYRAAPRDARREGLHLKAPTIRVLCFPCTADSEGRGEEVSENNTEGTRGICEKKFE